MGMMRQIAHFILKEHVFKPIGGDVLTIGKQKVSLTPEQAFQLLAREGVEPASIQEIELDGSTLGNTRMTITDKTFFQLLSDCTFSTVDISDYEGADILHDLSQPLPDDLANRADFIYNGGCLDNIFDPATAIKCFSRLLRPGGRIIHAEMGALYPSSYLMYSTDWFLDYYIINNFADCKTYVALFDDFDGQWIFLHWQPMYNDNYCYSELLADKKVLVLVVAEKGENSTWEKSPIQTHYRADEEKALYIEGAKRFGRSPRPIVDSGIKPDSVTVHHPCYTFCGFF